MKITILALGSRGDIQPFIALGKGLQKAGYEVNIATHPIFEAMVRHAGLEFSLIQANPQEMLETEAGRTLMESWGNPIRAFQHLVRTMKPHFLQGLDDCWNACQGTSLIVFSTLGLSPGMCIAEKLNIPVIAAFPQPFHPTAAFPCLMIANRNVGRFLNRLTYSIALPIPWLLTRSMVNEWRQQRLKLPPLGLNYFPGQWMKMRSPAMYAFSPNVVPRPAEWGDHIAVTGYWFLEHSNDWQPPAELVDFLEAGPPPVYVGFGSMSTRNPEELADLVLQALEQAKQRGILLTGWGGLNQADLPDHVFKIESAPHGWLFPRMAAVAHHGGAGTTAAGLRAGIPTIIIPFLLDQPFWGKRITDLGVGPSPIPRKKLSIDRLTAAITSAVTDSAIRQRAAALGERIHAEDGVGKAIDFIKRYL